MGDVVAADDGVDQRLRLGPGDLVLTVLRVKPVATPT
jgi:hypothetical protein